MVANFMFPPAGFGPGSQPGAEEGEDLAYLAMPSGMRVFEPHTPMVDDPQAVAVAAGVLADLAKDAEGWTPGFATIRRDIADLDKANRAVVADAMGEGEVAIAIRGARKIDIQESVFAGVWRVAENGAEHIEIGAIPTVVLGSASDAVPEPPLPGPGVVNAPAILTEVLDHAGRPGEGNPPHVVNLTLLPHTPEDLDHLDRALGRGAVTILSRGYGNCRIEQTARANVWRVRYYNSQDALILDSIEITTVPEVALAAPEDIADSAERLAEVAEALT
ncbi:hypothetical protein HDIA_0413 [Hartmannibacter diazotrophicus]|uniref:HupH hydrogenase expression protein C-terminal domain-containing protein n=1 Tax=Hartmannibacter diazotrophicus TaxID=1482074 RepID=A0A2C9D141_9HYPH|nr:hydrogenase expression/formation protein [Hartmannibacter diazotrophicus]SON53954.1 hypothetical protein HDIA_0413 [Hartmannibacter diazotrophicus]